jgi:hypothetical protein
MVGEEGRGMDTWIGFAGDGGLVVYGLRVAAAQCAGDGFLDGPTAA